MANILLVDDNAENLYLLVTLLQASGHVVQTASNGVEALEITGAAAPDIVISDILMPLMDGFELCRRWKGEERLRQVPFVFYTATYTDAKDEKFALSLGAERFITKPQEPQVLVTAIEEVLAQQHTGQPTTAAVAPPEETVFVKAYNETLIRKLEQKMLSLEQEVRARQQTEEALSHSEARYRWLFQTMWRGVIYHDHEGKVTDANPAAERILGLTLDQMRGQTAAGSQWQTMDEYGSLLDYDSYPANVALRTGQPVENQVLGLCRPPDLSRLWLVVSAIPMFRPGEDKPYQVCTTFADITDERQHDAERELTSNVLAILNEPDEGVDTVRRIVLAVKDFVGVEAVGLRLREGEDFPYYVAIGFPDEFVALESSLRGEAEEGAPGDETELHCLCGCVIRGDNDPTQTCFTPGGSFWTNNAMMLSEHCPAPTLPAHLRDGCPAFGYKSLALIPLRSGEQTIGLLQLNDRRSGLLSISLVHFLEKLGATVGIAIARKRTEDALRQSEELFRRIVQDQTEMICRSLPDGTITFANEAYGRFFDQSPAELVGQSIYSLMPPDVRKQFIEAVATLTPEAPTTTVELRFPRPDGHSDWTHWQHRAYFGENGQLVAAQATGSDVTALKMAAEEHRLAALGQLAAGVAHDFNNLLQGMGGTAQLVELGRQDCAKLVEIVLRSTRTGSEITRNLMAFARPDEPRTELGHLEASLDAALAVATRQLVNAEITVERGYATSAQAVVFDTAQMEMVFLNLIINASHAMPTGGVLKMRTEYHRPETGGGQAVVRISDTGTGIAPEHLDRIWEPFFTTKGRLGESDTPGSGLGLSVSRGLVSAHGGTITVSSILGEGTIFEIRLPLPEEPGGTSSVTTDSTIRQEDMARLRGARVLVAEDAPDVLALLQNFLGVVGSTLTTATTAKEAIEALQTQQFDIVISDLMMPGGGGRAVAAFCREMGEQAPPLVVMSGRLERSLHDEMIALGASRSIEKPFGLGELLRVLAAVLSNKRS